MKMRPLLVALGVIVILPELLFGFYYRLKIGSLISPSEIVHERISRYVNTEEFKDCPGGEGFAPLPYLGYGRPLRLKKSCGPYDVANNRGLPGPDFPEKKDPTSFTVLLTGGSVAERFGLQKRNGVPYFEDFLNQRYRAPNGKKFRVLVAALSDYRMPQQQIAVLLFQDVIDAVVDFSGFNEAMRYRRRERLEKPADAYWDLFQGAGRSRDLNAARELVRSLEESPCRFSYACVYFAEARFRSTIMDLYRTERFPEERKLGDFPGEVPQGDLWDLRLQKHRGYYRNLKSLCQSAGLSCSFFLQPAPGIQKKLSARERIHVTDDLKIFYRRYQRVVDGLLPLAPEIPLHSLLGIYSHESGTIYSDHIHLQSSPHGITRGYEVLAEALGREMAKDWGLQRK